jgi:hypothetical protein
VVDSEDTQTYVQDLVLSLPDSMTMGNSLVYKMVMIIIILLELEGYDNELTFIDHTI